MREIYDTTPFYEKFIKIKDNNDYKEHFLTKVRYISIDEGTIFPNIDENIAFYKTNIDNPLIYEATTLFGDSNTLYINNYYFEQNKEEITKLLVDTIENSTASNFTIQDSRLINKQVIDAVSKNTNFKIVHLGDISDFTLTKEFSDILLTNKNIEKIYVKNVDEEHLYDFNERIKASNQCNMCGTNLNMEQVVKNDKINLDINKIFKDEDLKGLTELIKKYPEKTWKINFKDKTQAKSILDNIKDSKILLNYNGWSTEEIKYLSDFSNLNYDIEGNAQVSSKDRYSNDIILNLIVEDIKSNYDSPLEQYMALYNVTKLFKEYKKSPEDMVYESRNANYVLLNDKYMVCSGYANLLDELVKRLDNPNLKTTPFSLNVNNEGHSRLLTKIFDPKYGIDGVYISDPTWDHVIYENKKVLEDGTIEKRNISHVDFYNHMLMTKKEVSADYNEYDDPIMDIIFSKDSAQEVIEEINNKSIFANYYEIIGNHLNELGYNIEKDNKSQIIDTIQSIDNTYIDGTLIIDAVKNLYEKIYAPTINKDKIDEMLEKTIHNNRLNQEINFRENKEKFGKL